MASQEGLPSPAQIALALVIVKSKPAELTIEVYFEHIRESVSSDPQTHHSSQPLVVDTTRYWQTAYDALQTERDSLRARLEQLEQHLETTKSKRATQPVAKANTQTKRSKVDVSTNGGSEDSADVQDDHEIYEGPKLVLRAHFALSQALAKQQVVRGDIQPRLRRLCDTLSSSMQENTAAGGAPQHLSIDEIRTAIKTFFPTILTALDKLERQEQHIALTPSLTRLFQSLLAKLHQLAVDEVIRLDHLMKSKKKKVTANVRALQRDSALHKEQHEQACQALTATLKFMLSALISPDKCREEILEAFACVFFDHLGSILSLCVFADPSVPSASGLGLVPPQGLLHVAGIDTDSALVTARLEAPYVLEVLKAFMSVMDTASVTARKEGSRFLGVRAGKGGSNSMVLHGVRDKLQNTLLRAVFGSEDEAFKDCLKRSVVAEEQNLGGILVDQGQAEDPWAWFIAQVWEHLGWEVISKNI